MVQCSTTILHYEPLLARISYSVSLQAISLHIHFQLCFALVCFIVSVVFSFQLRKLVVMHMQIASPLKYSSHALSIIDQTCQSFSKQRAYEFLSEGLDVTLSQLYFIRDGRLTLPLHFKFRDTKKLKNFSEKNIFVNRYANESNISISLHR